MSHHADECEDQTTVEGFYRGNRSCCNEPADVWYFRKTRGEDMLGLCLNSGAISSRNNVCLVYGGFPYHVTTVT